MMSQATGLPLSSTFDDADLTPVCLPPPGTAKPKEPAGEIGIEAFMEIVFKTILPHPACYQAVCDAVSQWYDEFRQSPTPAPA